MIGLSRLNRKKEKMQKTRQENVSIWARVRGERDSETGPRELLFTGLQETKLNQTEKHWQKDSWHTNINNTLLYWCSLVYSENTYGPNNAARLCCCAIVSGQCGPSGIWVIVMERCGWGCRNHGEGWLTFHSLLKQMGLRITQSHHPKHCQPFKRLISLSQTGTKAEPPKQGTHHLPWPA